MTSNQKRRVLTVFSLTMITIGSVDSIRNLPVTALFGSTLIFFFLLGAIFFMIPSAMVSAELSSSWPKQGGVYIWAREAFGVPVGYIAIWFQWIENVIWYPTIMSFVAGTISQMVLPSLANNPVFLFSIILIICWGVTIVNLFGMKSSAWVSTFCSLAGLILPMVLIIIAGAVWIIMKHPLQISFSPSALLPNLTNPSSWISLTGIILSFCGMEIATVHAFDVKNPQRSFPRALFYSSLIIISTLIFGSLSIAIVLPHNEISLVAGIMQAFHSFFKVYHMNWVVPIIGVLLVFGGIGQINNWIIGPVKGLFVAAQDGNLPPFMQITNKHYVPVALLLIQACIVSLLASVFLFLPSVNESYWLLTALASQIYMLMYIIMFAAGIYLRFKYPNRHRPYKIPGGKKIGMIVLGSMGILAAVITIIVGFFPPEELHIHNIFGYEILLISGLIVMIAPPIITGLLKKPHWVTAVPEEFEE